MDDDAAAGDLSTSMAALSVTELFRRQPLDRIARAQERHALSMHAEMTERFASKTFGKVSMWFKYVIPDYV